MGTALLICAVALCTAAIVALLCRQLTSRQTTELEARFLRQLSEVEESHRTSIDLMQAGSDQLVKTGSVYIDRLRADAEALRHKLADQQVAHEIEIAALHERIALLEGADKIRRIG